MIYDKLLARKILADYSEAMIAIKKYLDYDKATEYLDSIDMDYGICAYCHLSIGKDISDDMVDVNLGLYPVDANTIDEIIQSLQKRIDFLKTQI